MAGHQRSLDDKRLGAPEARARWSHGTAGRVDEGCRVDCWLQWDGRIIARARFEVFGGPQALDAAAWLAEWLGGRDRTAADAVTGRWLADAVGLTDEARTAALCIEDALRAAVDRVNDDGNGGSDEH
jgi:nitrogen fixation NifU-like protein